MPNRIIKESICTSDNLDTVSPEAEIFFYRLMVVCDDYGIIFANPSILRSKCFPLRIDRVKDKDIQKWLCELSQAKIIFLYEYESRQYLKFTKWEEHQQVRATKSKYPTPDLEGVNLISIDISGNQLQANVPVIDIRNRNRNSNRESNIHLITEAPHIKLTEEDYQKLVQEYGVETTNEYAQRLNDYIEQIGVAKASAKYKSHLATIRNWYRRDKDKAKTPIAKKGSGSNNPFFDMLREEGKM
jgi:predicted house-cleaning noncanonical NTP pyrophosphatase (MazG superfamily)